MIKLKSLLKEQTEPGDPSQATVDLPSIMTELKTACTAFNNEIAYKTKLNIGDKGLTTLVIPEGMVTTGGPYITITSPYFQNIFGTKRPYGHIGVELSKGYYGINWPGTTIVKGVTLKDFILGAQNFISYTVNNGEQSEKGKDFVNKHQESITAAFTTLFNTVDPIFKKLLAYKGYNSATTSPTGEVTISKTA